MKGMILAAGRGTRLLPLTLSRAKAAVPYRNRPLICHCLDALIGAGVNQVAVNLHYLPESVREALAMLGPSSEQVRYSYEPVILGTGGALNPVRDWLESEPFLLLNGKIVFDFDLRSAVSHHRQSGALATLLLVDSIAGEAFNPVFADASGRVTGFAATPAERALPGFVFTGIHVLDPGIFRYVPPSGFSDMVRDVYVPAIRQGEFIGSYRAAGRWLEFSTLARYLRLNLLAPGGARGRDCVIASSARLLDTVVWNRVRIAEECELRHCVVADDVNLPAGAKINNAVLVPGARATPEFSRYVTNGCIVYPLERGD
ncbi:MAG: NDP-sugar synthase [Acidobacteria bacterium]|nr:NDP-sugar synthase [Acidobacteriota bacterium]